MTLSVALKTRLLGAIETDTLVFLCGAGLSLPSPSDLPLARQIAEFCYDKLNDIEPLDPTLRHDIDKLAGHFYANGNFASLFIPLVPWNELAGDANKGHAAIGDLLISRAAHAALSANFDTMIERWGATHKIDLQGALTGQEAVAFHTVSSPLLKFHGCMSRGEKSDTLWTQGQLTEPGVQTRISGFANWMNVHLPRKHLIVVGFWTDWGYLNQVLGDAFSAANAASVTVIDPCPTAALQSKAPDLWDKLTSLSEIFEHVQSSSDVVLDELRTSYSTTWAKRFYALGAPLAAGARITTQPTPDVLTGEDLYNLRRDAEGLPYTRAATQKRPPQEAAEAALAHIELVNAGAVQQGSWLNYSGRTVRVVNGAGRGLDDVRQKFIEPATIPHSEIVICAGAVEQSVPARLIATGSGSSIISPAPGGSAKWLTRPQALRELGF